MTYNRLILLSLLNYSEGFEVHDLIPVVTTKILISNLGSVASQLDRYITTTAIVHSARRVIVGASEQSVLHFHFLTIHHTVIILKMEPKVNR